MRHLKLSIIVPVFAGIVLFSVITNSVNVDALRTNKNSVNQTPVVKQLATVVPQLSYMPGSSSEGDGVRIHDSNFMISSQDGKTSQVNSPVNLYGTHYIVNGPFTFNANLTDIQSDAYVTLYGRVPITQDEFRVEPPRIVLHFTASTVEVSVYKDAKIQDIDNKAPVFTKTFARQTSSTAQFSLKRLSGIMTLSINGEIITTSISENNIFKAGQLWIGATSKGGEFLLSNIFVNPDMKGTVQSQDASTMTISNLDPNGLQSLASKKRPGFLVGAAMSLAPIVSDSAYDQVAFGGNFGSMTTENSLKWQFVEPKQGMYDFHEGDALVDAATRNGLVVHGHTLVFAEANPDWVRKLPVATSTDKQNVQKVMTDHIANVVGHYKSKIATWDVVNEPIADYDAFNSSKGKILRNHKFYQAMGESYIGIAFNAAHTADPQARLYMNEYGLEENGDRWNAFLALVTKLKSQGVPIDGVGFESHVYEKGDKINPTVLKSHIQQLAKIGLTARISEMDVYNDDGVNVQSAQYRDVFAMCLSEPNCVSWTTWGVSDKYDMFMDGKTIEYGQDLLWSDKMKPNTAIPFLQKVLAH